MSTSSDAQDFSQPHQHPSRTSERFSIDLSLELEHQLESMESPSVHNAATVHSNSTKEKHESLDPHVLAHIIMQLRHSLTEMTRERDELVKTLSAALSKEAELNDALQLVTDKATTLEENLAEAKKKVREGEEAVTLLRSKVEESRRGLMRLQTESRRQSGNFEALRGATMLSFGGNPPSKRASFSPLTGTLHPGRANGHQRLSSMSDTSIFIQPTPQDFPSLSPRTSEFPSVDVPLTSRRASGVFGRSSSPHSLEVPHSSDDSVKFELESLRKELQSAKEELNDTKHRLTESNEAREASEICVNALRDFIAENNIGVREVGAPPTMQLPLPPTMATEEEAMGTHKPTSSGGWGFGKLWNGSKPSISGGATIASPSLPTKMPQNFSGPTQTPLTKKFGGFFSSRQTIPGSLLTSGGSSVGCTPQFQSNAALTPTSHRGSLNGSDASSITEPASLSEINTVDGGVSARLKELIIGDTGLEYATGLGAVAKDVQVVNETMIIARPE